MGSFRASIRSLLHIQKLVNPKVFGRPSRHGTSSWPSAPAPGPRSAGGEGAGTKRRWMGLLTDDKVHPLMRIVDDRLHHAVQVLINLRVPHPQHHKAELRKGKVASLISHLRPISGMLGTVDLNGQPRPETGKVEDVPGSRDLPPEVETLRPQFAPSKSTTSPHGLSFSCADYVLARWPSAKIPSWSLAASESPIRPYRSLPPRGTVPGSRAVPWEGPQWRVTYRWSRTPSVPSTTVHLPRQRGRRAGLPSSAEPLRSAAVSLLPAGAARREQGAACVSRGG